MARPTAIVTYVHVANQTRCCRLAFFWRDLAMCKIFVSEVDFAVNRSELKQFRTFLISLSPEIRHFLGVSLKILVFAR